MFINCICGSKCLPGGMMNRSYPDWMWRRPAAVLVQAERLHKHIFRPRRSVDRDFMGTPMDILETDLQVLVLVALPGVSPENVEAIIDDEDLLVTGIRILPSRSGRPSSTGWNCRRVGLNDEYDFPPGVTSRSSICSGWLPSHHLIRLERPMDETESVQAVAGVEQAVTASRRRTR